MRRLLKHHLTSSQRMVPASAGPGRHRTSITTEPRDSAVGRDLSAQRPTVKTDSTRERVGRGWNQSKAHLPHGHGDNFHNGFVQTLADVDQRGSSLAHPAQEKSCKQAQGLVLAALGAARVLPRGWRLRTAFSGQTRSRSHLTPISTSSYGLEEFCAPGEDKPFL